MIGIVTLYDSPNCGSKLQAFALSHVLENLGKKTVFLKTGARKPFVNKGKSACKFLFQGKFRKALFYLMHIWAYFRTTFKFDTVELSGFNQVEKIVLGSDEIWNVARNDIAKYPFFWGRFLTAPKISYAPSINQSTQKDFEKILCYDDMNVLEAISVRDEHSRHVIADFLKREVSVVCDPTMLLTATEWSSLEKTCSKTESFILLYCFAYQINDDDVKKIKDFAKTKKMKLISVADYLPFADENLPLSPEEFVGYIHNAAYVISSTFHGTCFSLIFQKKFVAISRNSPKVENLLSFFNAACLNAVNSNSIFDVLCCDSGNEQRFEILKNFRDSSLKWLSTHIA